MNGETDYGIIMSSLAMGDLRDTQSRIRILVPVDRNAETLFSVPS